MDTSEPSAPAPAASNEALGRTIRSVGRSASIMLVATLCLLVFQFLTRVLVIHAITVQQWGDFSLGLAQTSFLALLSSFGVPTAVARSLAFETTLEDRWKVVRTASTVTFSAAVVAAVLVFLFATQIAGVFGKPELGPILALFSVTVAATMVSQVLAGFFQGLERVAPNAIFNQILNPALFLVFTSMFLFFHWGFEGALLGYVLSWVASLAALGVYTAVRLRPALGTATTHAFEGDASARVPFFELAITLFGVAALAYVTSYGDTIILGLFKPSTDVAQYSTAMTLARLFLVSAGTITYIFLPVSARLRRQRDFGTLRRSYVTSSRWLLAIALPMFFVFFFDAGESLRFTFGAAYVVGAPALQVLALSSFVAVLLGPAPPALGGMGESRLIMGFTLASSVVNIGLSFTIIPLYGLMGAAVAWSVARVLYPGLCLVRLTTAYQVTPFRSHNLKPHALSLAILIPVFVVVVPHPHPIFLPLLFLLAVGVFLGSIVATRSIDPGDLVIIGAVERWLHVPLPRLRKFLERRTISPVANVALPTGG